MLNILILKIYFNKQMLIQRGMAKMRMAMKNGFQNNNEKQKSPKVPKNVRVGSLCVCNFTSSLISVSSFSFLNQKSVSIGFVKTYSTVCDLNRASN